MDIQWQRYYLVISRKDIQMHSFDNAISVAKKNDNWEQLEKFFRKKSKISSPSHLPSPTLLS